MNAELIAATVADVKAGRFRQPRGVGDYLEIAMLQSWQKQAVVVDVTAIYKDLVGSEREVWFYEDHPSIAPPWRDAWVCYVNEHGNCVAMNMHVREHAPADRKPRWSTDVTYTTDADGNTIVVTGDEPDPTGRGTIPSNPDWSRVRWTLHTFIWIGSSNRDIETMGPAHLLRYAVYDDGAPADLSWVHIVPEYPFERWDMASATLLGALNFLNCRNVELVEPARPRGERRRLQRMGAPPVRTINVFPPGKTRRSTRGEPVGGVPVSPVRGHFAHYGEQYNRGLLFGKYEGKFWIEQHARGSVPREGDADVDYRLVTK